MESGTTMVVCSIINALIISIKLPQKTSFIMISTRKQKKNQGYARE
mgnify:FL=1